MRKRMSALPPKADMCSATRYVRFVPIADINDMSGCAATAGERDVSGSGFAHAYPASVVRAVGLGPAAIARQNIASAVRPSSERADARAVPSTSLPVAELSHGAP